MNKLLANFEMDKYGLHVRLVNEDDAEFIIKLRTNPKLAIYIHHTDNNIEKQRNWIREYKRREKDGLDYYFIYYYLDKPIGVNRIYNIYDNLGTIGSWLCSSESNVEQSIGTLIILRDILFEVLNLEIDRFDVRKKNKHVLKLHLSMGAKIIEETDTDYFLEISKSDYLTNRNNFLTLLNLKQ